jgi:inosine/xanthosine triphosphatase
MGPPPLDEQIVAGTRYAAAAVGSHRMMIIVGSTRQAKVEAARGAVEAIARVDARFADAVIQPIDVTAIAPTMPMTNRETFDGARLRAQTLLDQASRIAGEEPFVCIGVEGGLEPLPSRDGRYVLKTWAASTDGIRWGFGAGGAILLPDRITQEVLDGHELGDVMDRAAAAAVRSTRGAWGVLTLDLIGRQDSFRAAILAALAPFYNPTLYQD